VANLSKKHPEKEKNPKENDEKNRQNHCQQAAEIGVRFGIIRRGTARASTFVCQKRSFAMTANFELHIHRIK